MKEQTSIIKNDGIVDFAFNPETRKRTETLNKTTGGLGPTSPINQNSVMTNSVEGALEVTEADRRRVALK